MGTPESDLYDYLRNEDLYEREQEFINSRVEDLMDSDPEYMPNTPEAINYALGELTREEISEIALRCSVGDLEGGMLCILDKSEKLCRRYAEEKVKEDIKNGEI